MCTSVSVCGRVSSRYAVSPSILGVMPQPRSPETSMRGPDSAPLGSYMRLPESSWMLQYSGNHGSSAPLRTSTLPLIRPLSVFMRCRIRLALCACAFEDASESAVLDGEVDLLPAVSGMLAMEGADGGDVEAGTLARYSAPALGELMLAMRCRLLASTLAGDRSLLRSSSVRVRGRDELGEEAILDAVSLPLPPPITPLREELRASIPATDEPLRLLGGLCEAILACLSQSLLLPLLPLFAPASRSLTDLLLLGPLAAAAPPTMVVVVWGMKFRSKLFVPRSGKKAPSLSSAARSLPAGLATESASSGDTARIVPRASMGMLWRRGRLWSLDAAGAG